MSAVCIFMSPLRRASIESLQFVSRNRLEVRKGNPMSLSLLFHSSIRPFVIVQCVSQCNQCVSTARIPRCISHSSPLLSSSFSSSSSSSFANAVTTQAVEFSNLVEMQTKVCQLFSDRPALGTFRDGKYEWMSYGDLQREVTALRTVLSRSFNICGQDKVAIISNNRVEWAVAFFAVNSLGAQLVPMYEAQSAKDWEFIVRDSESKLLIVANEAIRERTQGFLGHVGQLRDQIVLDCEADKPYSYRSLLTEAGKEEAVAPVEVRDTDTSVIIYTSGTTGQPKGVPLQHRNIVAVISGSRLFFSAHLPEKQVSLAFLPWAHVYGLSCELLSMLSTGNALSIVHSRELIMPCLAAAQPNILISVPALYSKIYDGVMSKVAQGPALARALFNRALTVSLQRSALVESNRPVGLLLELQFRILDNLVLKKIRDKLSANIRVLTSGGAAVPRPVLDFFSALGLPILEGYGLTETSPIVCMNGLLPGNRLLGTVGCPLEGVTVRIVDPDTLLEVPPDQDGEITVSGPIVMAGYHKNPAASAEVFYESDGQRFFRTGDLGRMVAQGPGHPRIFLKITGRIKEQFKLENGKYVVPVPVEDALSRSAVVEQVFLSGSNHHTTVALIVPNLTELAARLERASSKDPDLAVLLRTAPSDQTAFEQLFAREDVRELFNQQLNMCAHSLKSYAKPAVWFPLREPFSQENEQLTPKMSLRRNNIRKKYQQVLEDLHLGKAGVRVTYAH